MQNETFRKIVSTKYYEAKNWKNKNKMLSVYEGGIGVKTGYTKQAGRCLVSAAEREDMTLICTVLSCPTTYERSARLLDDAFEAYSNVLLLGAQERVALQIDGKTVYGISQKDCYYPLLEAEREWVEIVTIPHKKAGKRKKSQEIVGEFQIYLSKRLIFSGNLYKL
jgi:D-alanyl-D-alanine carboxypeptidase